MLDGYSQLLLNVAIQIYNICKGRLGSRGVKGVV